MSTRPPDEMSRREFLEGTGAALVLSSAAPVLSAQRSTNPSVVGQEVPRTAINVVINGKRHDLEVEDRWTLVELLRDRLKLTGTKVGCDRGECGACTVLLDGKPVYSCSSLAVWANGHTVDTVEGLSRDGRLDPLQQAFIEHNAPQCGFCTPGQLMTAKALLTQISHPTAPQVRAAMAGTLCRCANYNAYVEAILAAANGSASAGSGSVR